LGAIVDIQATDAEGITVDPAREYRGQSWVNAVMLFVSLVAGTTAFLPFALDTSPWDAVTLRVPGNQGNWWHVLVGAPFFLAYPMIWLRLRALFSKRLSTRAGRRLLWAAIGSSICGTVLVEAPFLFHLAGTSEWHRNRECDFSVEAPKSHFSDAGLSCGTQHRLSCQSGTLPGRLRRSDWEFIDKIRLAGVDRAFLAYPF
jgi:hypothetical protein